jgi:hypothetical protein
MQLCLPWVTSGNFQSRRAAQSADVAVISDPAGSMPLCLGYWLLCEAFHRPVVRKGPLLRIDRAMLHSPAPKTKKMGHRRSRAAMQSIAEWLEELGLGEYAQRFVSTSVLSQCHGVP